MCKNHLPHMHIYSRHPAKTILFQLYVISLALDILISFKSVIARELVELKMQIMSSGGM